MDSRTVGFFDSGLGGISVLGEALRLLPKENYCYLGDTLHIPYGDKPPEEVFCYTHENIVRLLDMGCKAIVIACNTATSVAAARLRKEFSVPIIGMEPALKPASLLPGDGKVLVMATSVTLALPKFGLLMERFGQDAIPVPCPGLMDCVEDGELEGRRVDDLLESFLAPYRNEKIKAVVLGCTHYPFLRESIARHLPKDVILVDGTLGTVRQLRRKLEEEHLLSDEGNGEVHFISTRKDGLSQERMRTMLRMWTERIHTNEAIS